MKKTVSPLKIIAINQATSFLFRSVLDALVANGAEVRLLTGTLENEQGYVPAFIIKKACKLQKAPAWRRIWTWSLFTMQTVAALVRHRDYIAFIVTNPPLNPWIAPWVKCFFGNRYVVLIYDVYPDVMERLGMIQPSGFISRCLRSLSARSHLMADHIVTLSDGMKQTVQNQVRDANHVCPITVIPNWADTRRLRPLPKEENPFAQMHGLVDKFVVMYSGAFGASHDIPNILDAAKLLEGLQNLRFVLIGGGTEEQKIRTLVRKQSLSNTLVLPWQPVDDIKYSLASADCHIVSQDIGLAGISVPSKTFTALAVGAVIIGIAPHESQINEIIEKYHCGILIPPRSSRELANAVQMLYSNPGRCKEMGSHSRLAAESEFNTENCTRKYVDLFNSFRALNNG